MKTIFGEHVDSVVDTQNGLLLYDRLVKIHQIITQYGEENFCMSYSGGKDSNVMHTLFDIALPDNRIPRVYCDTGIELNAVRDFVKAKAAEDDRFVIIRPKVPIKKMLEAEGYPFKSKFHSYMLRIWQNPKSEKNSVRNYIDRKNVSNEKCCPYILQYQFAKGFKLKISDLCCKKLKKDPLDTYQKIHKMPIKIDGIMASEGGQRSKATCLAFRGEKLKAFQPLAPLTKEWENWFITEFGVQLPMVYYPPYNFERTGCKGCPFNLRLQHDLDVLNVYFPTERKQCEAIWAPVYAEYRRLGYRLKPDDGQLDIWEVQRTNCGKKYKPNKITPFCGECGCKFLGVAKSD